MSQLEIRNVRLITRRDVFASWLRWLFFSHANYNWERLQGTGFAHAMTPIIRRLYQQPEDIRAALQRHLAFFNTEPDLGGVIHGIVIAMEEQRAMGSTAIDAETINNTKIGLMGPVAAIGDALKQGVWFVVWQVIGISLALGAGSLLGAIVYMVAMAAYTWGLGWWVYYQGFVQGQTLVSRWLRTNVLDDLRIAAAILGAMMLGALAPQLSSRFGLPLQTGLQFTVTTQAGESVTYSLQQMLFDAILPGLLTLLTLLLLIWWLQHGVTPANVIVRLLGVALASVLIESVSGYIISSQSLGVMFTDIGTTYPTWIGLGILVVGALWNGSRTGNLRGGLRFLAGFAVVLVVCAVLSTGASQPIEILYHF